MDDTFFERLFTQDFSEGTEEFRDALLARRLAVLDPECRIIELGDDDLDMLAAAGNPFVASDLPFSADEDSIR